LWDKTVVCEHLLEALRERGGIASERDLIHYLDSHQCFAAYAQEPANLQLFRKHFITRHCLYHLQEEISAEWRLDIGMITISLVNISSANSSLINSGLYKPDGADRPSSQLSTLDASLREYYLDLAHLEQADVESVEALLRDFWRRFAAEEKSPEALAVFELDSGASWEDIQRAYRRKVQRAHPDQGGTAAEFAALQDAYEILRQRFGKQR
jgi:hypothetical protein